MVEEGKPAPDFELQSDTGQSVRLSALRGKPVVLYFYPMDDTPGCTAQACGIRDSWASFEERGAVVLGVSPDGAESHDEFKTKYSLPFTLLMDPDHTVSEEYDVWVDSPEFFPGDKWTERSTFVIGADGNVVRIMRKVNPETHAADVLAALDG